MAFAQRKATRRLFLAVLVFFAVLSVAPWAGATVVSQCESTVIMSVPVDTSQAELDGNAEPQSLWSELPADADPDDCDGLIIERSGQVPVCLLEGASAVADQPIHDVDGTAVEAGDGGCFEMQAPDQVTPPSDEAPLKAPQAGPHATVVPMPEVPSMPPPLLAETTAPTTTFVPTGPASRIFRPPRG